MTTDPAIQIIAQTIYDNVKGITDMPVRGPEDFTSDAVDILEALRSAGYWVARWEPIEGHNNARYVLVPHDGDVGEAYLDSTGDWRLRGGGYVMDEPTHFMCLPPPPATNSENRGDG